MSTRRDKLQRLRVESPCPASWESMQGDERRRHCLQCDKPVYDFSQLTPREIAGVIEASQGHLCARLTRDEGGRLVTRKPPVVADPLTSRRVSPLVAAAVTAVLGLGGAAWADPVTPASPVTEQGEGGLTCDAQPQPTGAAGSTLSGTLTNEAGRSIPSAEIRLYNQLDGQEDGGRTDADGRFSFASVKAGIYQLSATVRGHAAARQADILLSAGEQRQVGLTVPQEVWQRIVAEEPAFVTSGGVVITDPEPMYQLYEDASLIVLAVAGKSVTVKQQQMFIPEARTELVISKVLKGEARQRVISVYHHQWDDTPEDRFQPGAPVLAFLHPRKAEAGRGPAGYVAADQWLGLWELRKSELAAYRERIEALKEIPESGIDRPAEILEWLVATAEDPATRKIAVNELSKAVQHLERQAEQHKIPVDHYAEDLRDVLTDFLSAGGTPEREVNPLTLAAFLTDAHRERLTKGLLRTQHITTVDLVLYELVSPWHDDRLLPWLVNRLETAELSEGTGLRLMRSLAAALDDEDLSELLTTGEAQFQALQEQRSNTSDAAARLRLEKQMETAEKELLRHFAKALRRLERR